MAVLVNKLKRGISLLFRDRRSFAISLVMNYCRWLPDKLYLRLLYFLYTTRKLDLKNPKRFNEKLQWLKLFDQKERYKSLVDKIEVKRFVSDKIGPQYTIPTLQIWDDISSMSFEKLPDRFVLKTNHDGGCNGVIICKNKNQIDLNYVKKRLKKSLKRDIYRDFREWPYKDIKHRVFAEAFLEESPNEELIDYKVMCFNGEPKLIQLHSGRNTFHKQDFYDIEWRKMAISQVGYPMSDEIAPKPNKLDEMVRLSSVLSKEIPFVRVDWYIVQNHLFFGEMTFFDASGFIEFEQDEYNVLLGDYILLPTKTKGND